MSLRALAGLLKQVSRLFPRQEAFQRHHDDGPAVVTGDGHGLVVLDSLVHRGGEVVSGGGVGDGGHYKPLFNNRVKEL